MPSTLPSDSAPRAWSLARRLTLWYTAATFALVVGVTAYQYWAVTEQLDEEDDRYLIDKIAELERILAHSPDDDRLLRAALAAPGRLKFHARIEYKDGRPPVADAGADAVLPLAFPVDGMPSDFVTAQGRSSRMRTVDDANKAYRILIAMDTTDDEEMLAPLRRRILYVLAASFLFAFLGGIILARRGLAPVARMSRDVARIRPTQLDARLAVADQPRELQTLGAEVNTMLARIEGAFGRLSQYSADIAHELRTPLNALRGTLEVAIDQDRDADDFRRTLVAALEESTLLIRLTEDMLLLAQAENPKTLLKRERIELYRFLDDLRDLYAPSADENGVSLNIDCLRDAEVAADRSLLQRVVVNLLVNAIAHTSAGGAVTLFSVRDGCRTIVGVRNTGTPIPVEEREAIFGRFTRGDRARTPQGGRVGLGLAIVKGIAELHGGEADAAATPAGETVVRIALPHLANASLSE